MKNTKQKDFVPPVRVTGILKATQRIEMDKYKLTYRGESKIVLSINIEFFSLSLKEAIESIDINEFNTLTITYNERAPGVY